MARYHVRCDGDDVIAPAQSWISTAETVTQAGAKVVSCDSDEDTQLIFKQHNTQVSPCSYG
jgi:dTDP-4-amino-4,6-dideoxygalactose transaminase